ncbi:DUF805 domain-containing protein [Macrococcus sp. EM39E]|uniref:DUF805 domain-containing protein n=1 Tax=Macrococcus animalis TaxID=3395467 RepID=UPI0039BDC2AB
MEKQMGWLEAYKLYWGNTFKYTGRSRMAEYWKPMIINFLIIFSILLLLGIITETQKIPYETSDKIAAFVKLSFVIVFLLPTLGVTIRRLHDVGIKTYHGVITTISYLIYSILNIFLNLNNTNFLSQMFGRMPNDPEAYISNIFIVSVVVFWIYNFIISILLLQSSNEDSNRYGKNPKL